MLKSITFSSVPQKELSAIRKDVGCGYAQSIIEAIAAYIKTLINRESFKPSAKKRGLDITIPARMSF